MFLVIIRFPVHSFLPVGLLQFIYFIILFLILPAAAAAPLAGRQFGPG